MAKPTASSSLSGKNTLQSVLVDSRRTLAILQSERLTLQQELLRKVQDINQTVTDYWATQAKSLPDLIGDVNCDVNEGQWQVEFATRETARAKAAAVKQKDLWSQVEGMVKEAKDRDDKFWATWQNSLDHFGAAHESTHQPLSSRGAKTSLQPRRKERLTRATTKRPAPRGPTAFTADRASSLVTKPANLESARPSTLSTPSDSSKPVRSQSGDNKLSHPEPFTSSSPAAPASSSSKVKKTKTTARQEKKVRPPRRVAAKSSTGIHCSAVTNSRPVKKRGLQKAAESPVNTHPVIDPKPGQLYQAYYHSTNVKERGWYMGTVLPWKSSDWTEETMIDFSMRDMDLSDWPDCCQPGYEAKVTLVDGKPEEARELTCIERWMPGFEDGGPRVMDRKFLFLFFEDRPNRLGCLNIDPSQPLSLIQFNPTGGEPVPIDWVDAKHLRMNTDDAKPVWGSFTAEKYRNKLDHVARLRQQARLSSTPTSQQHLGGYDGTTDCPMALGPRHDILDRAIGGEAPGVGVDSTTAVTEVPSGHSLKMAPHDGTPVDGQQNAWISPIFSISPAQLPKERRPSHKEQGSSYANSLSPIQMDFDEAYEEPHAYAKRTPGKRSLSNDDEYDEGLGMDYDLSLKRSATQMSRPQTSIMGLPPHKLPRLDDYNVPDSTSTATGFRTLDVGYKNADVSSSHSGSPLRFTASSSPPRGLMGPLS